MIPKHIIHQLVYELDGFKDNSEFRRIADKLSSITRTAFHSRVNVLLDKYSIKNYHLVINTLELDLGYINANNLENNLLFALEKALEKNLRGIHIDSSYKIKHGLIKTDLDLESKANIFYDQLERNQANTSVQISKEISHYLPTKVAAKVIPQDAKYLDAVIHFLQYGWLPKYLNIPMYQFDSIFTDTIMKYSAEIKNYFERKSPIENSKVQKRIIHQLSTNKFSSKTKNQKTKIVETVFLKSEESIIQPLIKAVEQLSISRSILSKKEKSSIIEVLTRLQKSSKTLEELTSIQKIIDPEFKHIESAKNIAISSVEQEKKDQDSKKNKQHSLDSEQIGKKVRKEHTEKLTRDFTSKDQSPTIKMPLSMSEEFEKRLGELLDSNDKSSFNDLLKSTFFKSLVKSHVQGSNKAEIIIRKFIPLIINPKDSQRIIDTLPAFIGTEEEIINQLYKTSPLIIAKTLDSLIQYEKNLPKRITGIVNLMSKLSKKRINLVLQSYFSYYSTISPKLNAVNVFFEKNSALKLKSKPIFQKLLETKDISFSKVMTLSSPKFIQTYLIIAISQGNRSPMNTMELFFKEMSQFLQKETIKIPKRLPSKVKPRIFKQAEDIIHSMTFSNIRRDYNMIEIENKETTTYMLKTLLKENYIPTVNKQSQSLKMTELIDRLEKHVSSSDKVEITQIFKDTRIYKNPLLSKLSTSDFKRLLGVSLSTEKARLYLKFYEKFHYMWKVKVDLSQIQLIFLSMIKYEAILNESTIFHYFYEELKIYKSWTYDVHKKLIIEVYELHEEKLTVEEKETMINYIDSVPTYQSLQFRDTKKKLAEGIPVKNAGLVLLWPFFKTLFGVSDFLDKKGDFKDMESRERATLLLQYLAVMSSAVEEPYLALNKVMTGFPLEESLPKEIILTDKEKDIADALLLNVIKQWPSFQNSTTDNLRGSFIIRDGILSFRGNQWVLRVESKAYDLLLGKLPWGFSMIRLSWIPYIIKVEWN